MIIQINTDKNISGDEQRAEAIESSIREALQRFGEWITRVEVQLSDQSSAAKATDDDKRCLMEARPAGMKPLIVSHNGANLEQAVSGCLKKLVKMLNETKDRLDGSKGSPSFAGDQQL